MNRSYFHALPQLRDAVRRVADAHRLPVDVRARLVLSVADAAADELGSGRPVELSTAHEDGSHDDSPVLAIALSAPQARRPLRVGDLPLPALTNGTDSVVWRVPVPQTAGSSVPSPSAGIDPTAERSSRAESQAINEELRAIIARTDALTAEYRRLKHELAETNGGVLALYVQLEERDEQLRKAHGKMLRDLEDALRPQPMEIDGLELAVHYAPAEANAPTGGDLYDWFALPDGNLHITVVDALGHGVGSTRSALNVTHAVRTLALEGHPLQSILERTHEILMPLAPELMATVLLARLDPATGKLQLANGSHPPALMLRADGTAEYLEVRGRGIGFPLPGSEELLHTEIHPGDVLILYTDGLTESRRDPCEGELRLIAAARRHAGGALAELPSAIAAEMHTVMLHPDDTLALAIRRSTPTAAVG
ncbi:PP2C family protein-serine/threonine phosphatase [Streptomyces durmitorensis]|uniref:Serine/threonine-protein phosphatase n=1 Tax=Streptomyces durmitorensis TaxID=319947 RepID=A0ABY4PR36_9ACTN|nr:PP2C family protein-serine/threonine phosphatase [Streptomyces durmitorensis]UQT55359.1 serine/threonine-protein phosphatase [Streptomyces durmitorensis]